MGCALGAISSAPSFWNFWIRHVDVLFILLAPSDLIQHHSSNLREKLTLPILKLLFLLQMCYYRTSVVFSVVYRRFKNVMFEIKSADEVGVFEVSAKFMGVAMEKVELVFQVSSLPFLSRAV